MMMMIVSGQKYTISQMGLIIRAVHSQTTWWSVEGDREIRPGRIRVEGTDLVLKIKIKDKKIKIK